MERIESWFACHVTVRTAPGDSSSAPGVRAAFRLADRIGEPRTVGGVTTSRPSFTVEEQLLAEFASLAALDEVGRGCVAGPVSVGAVLLRRGTPPPPAGVRDSKLLSPKRREELYPTVVAWAPSFAVGHASASEIDELGLVSSLRLAGRRAIAALDEVPAVVLLDGNHDWLGGDDVTYPVRTRVKADRDCLSVAAASILAKVERDALMCALPTAEVYGFAEHKGYLTAAHLEALRRHGPAAPHRRSWRVAGVPGFRDR